MLCSPINSILSCLVDSTCVKLEFLLKILPFKTTLLIVALIGGSIGMYYAMFKYKHKTLHKKFLYGVPLAMLLHSSMFFYFLIVGIMA